MSCRQYCSGQLTTPFTPLRMFNICNAPIAPLHLLKRWQCVIRNGLTQFLTVALLGSTAKYKFLMSKKW